MSSEVQITAIARSFADQYGLDLEGINRDAGALRTLIADNGVVSKAVDKSCYTYNGSQAVVPDLETTDPASIPADARIGQKRVEANLDEAIKYLQECLELRTEYGEIAKLRNDTRFKGEEFVRLDNVHLEEIAAGLYQLPWQEAANEKEGLLAALTEAQGQLAMLEAMFKDDSQGERFSAVLSDQRVDDNIQKSATITRNVANTNKDIVERLAQSTEGVRAALDVATWLDRLGSTRATVAQLTESLEAATRREKYLRADEGFRSQRAVISRQLAWMQIAEHCRGSSELNYDARLLRTKSMFDQRFSAMVERLLPIATGLREVYGLDHPLGPLEKGTTLETAAIWLHTVQNELLKYKRGQRLSLCTVVAKAVRKPDGSGLRGSVEVMPTDLPGSGLLRGIAAEYIGVDKGMVALAVEPPVNAWSNEREMGTLLIGRVGAFSPSVDLKPQHQDALWNGSAVGTWNFDAKLMDATTELQVALHLWILSST